MAEELVLRNNFKVPIKIKGIFNQNPEFRIVPKDVHRLSIILQPGEAIVYAIIEL